MQRLKERQRREPTPSNARLIAKYAYQRSLRLYKVSVATNAAAVNITMSANGAPTRPSSPGLEPPSSMRRAARELALRGNPSRANRGLLSRHAGYAPEASRAAH